MEYQKRLVIKLDEQREFQDKQNKLRKKYGKKYKLEDGTIQIVKRRILEVLLENIAAVIRTVVNILLIMLATVGGLALLNPYTRQGMYSLFLDLYNQAIKLLGT